jgi:hypothetical protein
MSDGQFTFGVNLPGWTSLVDDFVRIGIILL